MAAEVFSTQHLASLGLAPSLAKDHVILVLEAVLMTRIHRFHIPIPAPALPSPCLIQPPQRGWRTSHPEPLSLRVLLTYLPPRPGTPHQPCSRLSHLATWACSEHFFPPQPPCPPTIHCEVWGHFSGPQFLCLYNEGVKTEIEVLRWGLYLAFRVDEITCTLLCFNILM